MKYKKTYTIVPSKILPYCFDKKKLHGFLCCCEPENCSIKNNCGFFGEENEVKIE